MSRFLNSLGDKLRAMEQQMQTLPGELDSAVARLDRAKLRCLLSRLNENCNELFDKQFATQRAGAALELPLIMQSDYPYVRQITEEDLAKWRAAAYKSDVRVVMGKEGVGVIDVSELAREHQTTAPQVIHAAQEQGYIVLGWDDYKTLLDEIDSLIGEDEESGAIVGIPVTATDSPRGVKVLSKNSSRIVG